MSKDRFQRPVIIICLILILLELATAVYANDVLSQTAGSTSLDLQPMTRSPLSDPSGRKSALAHDLATRKSILNDASNVELVGQIGGVSHAVVVRDNFACVGEGSKLTILDISDPGEPLLIGKTAPLPGIVESITLAGNFAYVISRGFPIDNSGLSIINIADQAEPVETGFLPVLLELYNHEISVAINGKYVYVSNSDSGVTIIDVSNPNQPMQAGFYALIGVRDIVIAGDYAYLAADSSGLLILNVSNPVQPMEVGRIPGDSPWYGWWPTGVAVAGSHAYVTTSGFRGEGGGLSVVNIANPAEPVVVAFKDTFGPARAVAIDGNFAYVTGEHGLAFFDVSSPTDPVNAGNFDLFYNLYPEELAVHRNHAYVIDGSFRLRIINVSNPAEPLEDGFYNMLGSAENLDVFGDYAYVIVSGGLQIINIADPSQPAEAGFFATTAFIRDVDVNGQFAVVGTDSQGVYIINVANPARPTLAGFLDASWEVNDIAIEGDYAYVATRGDGLRIINISDPRKPLETSFFKGEFEAFGVAVVGDYAYLAAVNSGLLVINVADRANPFEVGFALTYGNALKVAVAGNHAYISNGYGLSIFDISNPSSPTATYLSDSLGGSCNVAADDNYIYATSDKVSVINVYNSSAPIEEGYFYPTWRLNCDVAVRANYIFLVGDGGLCILHFPGSVSYLPLAISL